VPSGSIGQPKPGRNLFLTFGGPQGLCGPRTLRSRAVSRGRHPTPGGCLSHPRRSSPETRLGDRNLPENCSSER